MNKEQDILLRLIANELFNKNYIIPKLTNAEWQTIIIESKEQAVLRIAYSSADKAGVPKIISDLWYQESLHYLENNLTIYHNHLLLNDWLTQADISYVILKGCSSAYYYPNQSDRIMGDVDFLIKKTDMERVDNVLKKHGLQPWDLDHICHIVYRSKRKHYEMHFDIPGVPNGEVGDLIHKYIDDIFASSFTYSTANGSIQLPSKFHHGLIIILHTSHHLTSEGIGLRHLCDWAVFLNSCSNEEFKDLFEEKFKSIGMWKFACVLSKICIDYLGCSPKSCIDDIEVKLIKDLIDDIFQGGNFGFKDHNRVFEGKLISDKGKGTFNSQSMIGNYVKSINAGVHAKWSFSKKCPIILPFGWFFFGTKRLFKIVFGKVKKPKIVKSIKVAKKRQDLYIRLGIFEIL